MSLRSVDTKCLFESALGKKGGYNDAYRAHSETKQPIRPWFLVGAIAAALLYADIPTSLGQALPAGGGQSRRCGGGRRTDRDHTCGWGHSIVRTGAGRRCRDLFC